jgi:hypothetical protein
MDASHCFLLLRTRGACRDDAQRRHLFELAHHTCLLVADAASNSSAELAAMPPPGGARMLAALTAAAARLMCYAAGGADRTWNAVAAAVVAAADGGRHTRALMDAATAALQALRPADSAAPDAAPPEPAAGAEAALDGAVQLLLERTPGSGVLKLRAELVSHVLTARASNTGGPPAGLRSATRLCTAALLASAHSSAGARCAARGAALLLALCSSPVGSFLDDMSSDPELLVLARPMFALAAEHLRACLQRPPSDAPQLRERAADARAAGVLAEEIVADAALQTASLRVCTLLLDDSTTRQLTVAALGPVLGATLAGEPGAFASRWCAGPVAVAAFAPWVAEAVRTLVGDANAGVPIIGWGGSPGEQGALLFGLLANVQHSSPAAAEEPGAAARQLAAYADGANASGAQHAVRNIGALLDHVLGNASRAPLCPVSAVDTQLVTQLAGTLARTLEERRTAE